MIWPLIAMLGFVVWLSVALLFVALCRAAARADARESGAAPEDQMLPAANPLGDEARRVVFIAPRPPAKRRHRLRFGS